MLKPDPTRRFKKDLKKFEHNKSVQQELNTVLDFLLKKEHLPEKYLDHPLVGNYVGFRECHIKSDTLLIYWVDDEYVHLVRIGSHSELF
jgi:mRNA interferase YafQ